MKIVVFIMTGLLFGAYIVDNASNSEEYLFLEKWKNNNNKFRKIVIHNTVNLGGSGGFYTGLEAAMELNADWIWVSDDDAFPELDALSNAISFMKQNTDKLENISAICSAVINNGKIDIDHRRILEQDFWNIRSKPVDIQEYDKQYFYLNLFSYVGVIINKEKLQKVGVTEKNYFIRFDDTEHSLRLDEVGDIVCVPKIKVQHNLDIGKENNTISWKLYYGVRNEAVTIKNHFSRKYFLKFCVSKLAKKFIKSIIHRNFVEYRITYTAINDAINQRMGIHEIYKPGWKYIIK